MGCSEDHFHDTLYDDTYGLSMYQLQIMGIIMVHMFPWCYPYGLSNPGQPRGRWHSWRMTWHMINLSCPFTLFNISDGLVMFVPLVEVASVAYHVSFILLQVLFHG
jgi:hypothetical protein